VFNYFNYAIQSAIGSFLLGILVTAIAMIFLKTKKTNNHLNSIDQWQQ
jgi:hypothetical protein